MSKRKKRSNRPTKIASRRQHPKRQAKVRALQKKRVRRAAKRGLTKPTRDLRLQTGLRLLRNEKSIAEAARKAGIPPAKLRAYAIKKKLLIRRGKKWVVQKDVPRKLLIYSDGKEYVITVSKFRTASLIGKYMAAVRWFVQTNDLHHLEPFAGKSVKDISGKCYPLESRPNVLHRLANSGSDTFEQIYRIVV